jgi:hypothetical protein
MIVYGDAERWLEPQAELRALRARLVSAELQADDALELMLRLGELAQGTLDDDLRVFGEERARVARLPLLRALQAAASAYVELLAGRSPTLSELPRALQALAKHPLPKRVCARVPEGFAHYALYPQLHAAAAAGAQAEHVRVVGIRTTGMVLGAVVAATVGAPPIHSVRPEGHPFERTIRASASLRRELTEQPGARWLIVDEGPGISGSSFLATARLLESCGVARTDIWLMPSHDGPPGAAANAATLKDWASYPKSVVSFERGFSDGLPFLQPRPSDAERHEALTRDLSGGRWRQLLFSSAIDWPPVIRAHERRKYLFSSDGATKLAKFAGLGEYGQRKLRRGRVLSARSFTPPLDGMRAGFVIGDWLEHARPARVFGQDRAACLDLLGRYLGYLASLPAEAHDRGAAPSALLSMAEHNLGPDLGSGDGGLVMRLRELSSDLDSRARPVYTDGKLEPWEWLVAADGVKKTDALDHSMSHDLVQAQDLEWDVAGARVELDLNGAEQHALAEAIARSGQYRPDAQRLHFYTLCYLAFKIGTLVLARAQEQDPGELSRLRRREGLYRSQLNAYAGDPR